MRKVHAMIMNGQKNKKFKNDCIINKTTEIRAKVFQPMIGIVSPSLDIFAAP